MNTVKESSKSCCMGCGFKCRYGFCGQDCGSCWAQMMACAGKENKVIEADRADNRKEAD